MRSAPSDRSFPVHPARLLQKRVPRETFTKRLQRICQALDEQPRRPVSYAAFWRGSAREETELEVEKLWVVGSYARGALACGDLDLVIQVRRISGGALPGGSEIARAYFGQVPLVRFFIGTPSENNVHLDLQNDAKEIWSPGLDWAARIAAVKVDPAAGAAPRPTDVLPLRPLQLDYYDPSHRGRPSIVWLERIAQLHLDGVWTADFLEISSKASYPALTGTLADIERFVGGKQSRRLMPGIGHVLAGLGLAADAPCKQLGQNQFRLGGINVFYGRPCVPRALSRLEGADCEAALLVPHFTREGPNGAWIMRRGPQHRLVQAFAEVGAWVVCRDSVANCVQLPRFRKELTAAPWMTGLELYTSRSSAPSRCFDGHSQLQWMDGGDLLNAMAGCDALVVDGQEIPAPRLKEPSLDVLLEALSSAKAPRVRPTDR